MTTTEKRELMILRTKKQAGKAVRILLTLVICVFFLFPFYWMITTSLKPYLETLQWPPTLWPETFTLNGYKEVLANIDVGRYVSNTLIVTFSIIIMQLIINVPAAYAFAMWDFKGSKIAWAIVMSAFMIPGQITYITTYFMFSKWEILGTPFLNTLLPQIIPFGANAFGIFLLRQNFKQIPKEIIESARLDGASEWGVIWKMMVPMSLSSMLTVALFSFIGHWNAYFWPLVMTQDDSLRPITMVVERIKDLEQGMNYTNIMAGTTIIILPIVFLFLACSKQIIRAMAHRGMK